MFDIKIDIAKIFESVCSYFRCKEEVKIIRQDQFNQSKYATSRRSVGYEFNWVEDGMIEAKQANGWVVAKEVCNMGFIRKVRFTRKTPEGLILMERKST